MKIAVINNKGGVGKSILAYAIALEKKYLFITNEPRSPAVQIFPENHALIMENDDSISGLDEKLNVVFDFKGNTTGNLVRETLIAADYIIVPVIYRDVDDIFPMEETIYSIREIEDYNSNIIIVGNDVQKHSEFDSINDILSGFFDYPILRLNRAKLFPRSIKNGIGVTEYIGENRLLQANYHNAYNQFKKILEHLER